MTESPCTLWGREVMLNLEVLATVLWGPKQNGCYDVTLFFPPESLFKHIIMSKNGSRGDLCRTT